MLLPSVFQGLDEANTVLLMLASVYAKSKITLNIRGYSVAKRQFPPIKRNPTQPWVEALPREARAEYEAARAHDIEVDREGIVEIVRSLPDFNDVPDDVIGYVALRLATPMRDGYEEGIQVGMDDMSRRLRPQLDEFRSREINRLGGNG